MKSMIKKNISLKNGRDIYDRLLIERDFPIEKISELAQREGNKKKPIYEMHKWWARRLGANIRAILIASCLKSSNHVDTVWKKFYEPNITKNTTILDPFMGGGTTLIEASKLGAKTIGIDIDPVAWFITKKEIEYCNPNKILEEFKKIEEDISKDILHFYKTIDHSGNEVDVIYYFWVDVIKCPQCKETFEGHPHYMLFESKKKGLRVVFCKKCHTVREIPIEQKRFKCKACNTVTTVLEGTVKKGVFTCPFCNHSEKITALTKIGLPIPKKLFALEYVDTARNRVFSKIKSEDLRRLEEAIEKFEGEKLSLQYPKDPIPSNGRSDRRPITHGYQYYSHLFNKRQLLCLSLLYSRINKVEDQNVKENLLLAFSDSLASNNMMCGYAFGYRKLTPLFSIHSYRPVSRPVEGNVWGTTFGRASFIKCINKLVRAKEYADNPYEFKYSENNRKRKKVYVNYPIHGKVATDVADWLKGDFQSLILNKDSTEIDSIPSNSVDLIITDPPYYDNLAYSELSDFYYVWLKMELVNTYPNLFNEDSTPFNETIMVRKHMEDEHNRYIDGISEVFINCARILKDDGVMVFTYHHKKRKAWLALGQSLFNSGFIITNVFPIRSEGKSGFHSNPGNIKWDSVFVCRKGHFNRKRKPTINTILMRIEKSMDHWGRRFEKDDINLSKAELESLKYSLLLYKCSKGNIVGDKLEDVFQALQND